MALAFASKQKPFLDRKSIGLRAKKPASDWNPNSSGPGSTSQAVSTQALTLSRPPIIQPKLKVGEPNDKYEQEADRVADEIMRMPDPELTTESPQRQTTSGPRIQKMCAPCEDEVQRQPLEEDEEMLQAKEMPGQTPVLTPKLHAQINGLKGKGQPLSRTSRSFFEQRMGYDFGNVRIHSGPEAARTAELLHARAYTVGNNIVFGEREYPPHNRDGRKLLAHELTHVVQQGRSTIQHDQVNTLQKKGLGSPTVEEHIQRQGRGRQEHVHRGFRIRGGNEFIRTLRDYFYALERTQTASAIIDWLESNQSGIVVEPSTACSFIVLPRGPVIFFNVSDRGCVPSNCPGIPNQAWKTVPAWIYFFHELAHAYEHYRHGVRAGRDQNAECRVTGMGPWSDLRWYSENRFRCYLHFPVRPCYAGVRCQQPPQCWNRSHGDVSVQRQVAVSDEGVGLRNRVADKVMRMLDPAGLTDSPHPQAGIAQRVQRMCSACEEAVQRQPVEENEETLRAKTTSGKTPEVSPRVQSQINGLNGKGQPLSHSTRAFFEPRLGYDLRRVRVHTSVASNESANAINARAFAVGANIVFGPGQYQPSSSVGRRLLAHELAHVIQQGGSNSDLQMQAAGTSSVARTIPGCTPLITGVLPSRGSPAGIVRKAHDLAILLAEKARDAPRERHFQPVVLRHFSSRPGTRNRVRLQFGRILRRLNQGYSNYVCDVQQACQAHGNNVAALQIIGSSVPHSCTICPRFFSDFWVRDHRSRPLVLIHEAAHAVGVSAHAGTFNNANAYQNFARDVT